jgi:hypothetical protein
MVLVEGNRADGLTVDHDVFDISAAEESANPSEQVISAILGTQQSALAGGHHLVATGVTWTDHDEAAALREGLADHGIEDVMLVSELHAAGALAQAVGQAVAYDKTALMLVDRDTATLSVVESFDGSIVKVLSRSLHSADAMAVMTEMVTSLEAHDARPGGLFVVGSGVDVTSVKEHLEHVVSIPVSAPEDSEIALARGAAIAAASAPRFEASTVGLAYSQDPDGPTAADPYHIDPAFAATQLRAVSALPAGAVEPPDVREETRRPFLLVGSTLTSIFVIGVVALVISLAVSIRPTADQRPSPGENVVVPSAAAPAPQAQAPAPAPAPAPVAPPPAPETIPAPVPVVQEQPQVVTPRTVVAVPQAPPPAPAPAAPPPAAPPPAPPPPAAPAPVPVPVPVYVPPVVGYPAPPVYRPPWYRHRPPYQPPYQPPVDDDDPPVVTPPGNDGPPVVTPPVVQLPPIIQLPQSPQLPSGPSRRGPRNPYWPW